MVLIRQSGWDLVLFVQINGHLNHIDIEVLPIFLSSEAYMLAASL